MVTINPTDTEPAMSSGDTYMSPSKSKDLKIYSGPHITLSGNPTSAAFKITADIHRMDIEDSGDYALVRHKDEDSILKIQSAETAILEIDSDTGSTEVSADAFIRYRTNSFSGTSV